MRRILLAIIVASAGSIGLSAQDALGKIACHAETKAGNRNYRKKLWAGFEISLGPARDSQGAGDECTAAIYNAAGRVVFRTTGFNVVFQEEHTGLDFDGDGQPEVVFYTDTGGGNHCCWAYNIVSLAPKPHKLFDIDAGGAVRFKKDPQGKMTIWQLIAGPYGFTSMARNPFAEKVFRVRNGNLVDETPEFCSQIMSDSNEDFKSWNSTLTPENLKLLQSSGNSSFESEEIVSALLSRALQNVFCGQFDAALNDLHLWPEATREKILRGFAGSIKPAYPDFASRLLGATARH